MSVVGIIVVWFAGWLVYRVLQRDHLELSPASIALTWVLGTGLLHTVYYLSITLTQQNPSHLILFGVGIIGAVEFVRLRQNITLSGWKMFRTSRLATVFLMLVISLMTLFIAVDSFHQDTIYMWDYKAQLLAITPDYHVMMEHLLPAQHADYPMVYTHQLQWQASLDTSLISLKLPTWMSYICILLGTSAILTHFNVRHPVWWLIFLAGFPQYWSLIPTATADIPLSMYFIVGVVWLLRALDGHPRGAVLAGLCFGWMALTKNEGSLLFICVLAGLAGHTLTHRQANRKHLSIGLWVTGVVTVLWLSWYGLIVGTSPAPIISDFSMSGFRIGRIPEVAGLLLPVLLNPFLTAGLWIVGVGCLLTNRFKQPMLWIPVALYILLISSTYLFSVRETGLYAHVVQSYFRLLLHVTPLAVVYLASCFSGEKTM